MTRQDNSCFGHTNHHQVLNTKFIVNSCVRQYFHYSVKVKQSLYRHGEVQRVPGV
jgi:hypothetical protein